MRIVADALRAPYASGAIAIGLVLSSIYGLISLWLPLGWDHGFMASVGETMSRGGVLYRDAWEIKGPMAYVPFALSNLLFGNVMWGVRLVDLAIVGGTLFVLHRLVAEQTSIVVGAATSLALYLWFSSSGWFFTAQPDEWVALLTALAVCLLFPRKGSVAPSVATFALVGMLIALCGLVKPFYLGFGLVPLSFLAAASDVPLRRRARLAAALAGGAAAPFIAALLYFAASGALGSVLEIQVEFNLGTYADVGNSLSLDGLEGALRSFFTPGLVTILLPFAAAGLWARRGEPKLFVPLLAWLGLTLLSVIAQGKFYTYQWFPLYPALLVCAAFGAHAVWGEGSHASKVAVAAAAMVFAAYIAEAPARTVWGAVKYAAGARSEPYYDRFEYLSYRASDQMLAASHIRERTAPDEGVFVWGNDATLRFLSGRPNPSRFTYSMPLSFEGSLRERYRAELMQDLTDAPPAYVVVGMPWSVYVTKEQELADFPEFASFLEERYDHDVTIGFLDLYRRADGAAVAAASR